MRRLSAGDLLGFVAGVIGSKGMAREHAEQVADALVWANLRGVDSHGVVRLPRYLEMIDLGIMNVRPRMSGRTETSSCILIEADRAPGPVAMVFAADQATAKAKQDGIGLAIVGNMTHSAALGYYTLKCAEAGLACLAVSATIPIMPYHGARGAALGTNPISIAVPGGGHEQPLVFDMATSVVSFGKLMQARKTGAPLQAGWAVDAAGLPTVDPAAAVATLPLGGPKGSGLSLMIECLASLLSGNPLIADTLQAVGQGDRHRQNGLLIAIDIATFCELSLFRGQVERLARVLRALPRMPDAADILMPGERGFRIMAERRETGIPIPDATWGEFEAMSEQYRVCMPASLSTASH